MLGGASVVGELVSGERNFSDAPMPEITDQLAEAEGLHRSRRGDDDGRRGLPVMAQGDIAMTTGGVLGHSHRWKTLGDNLRMIQIPNFSPEAPLQDGGIGGVGNCFIVTNYSQVKDEAVTFIKFLMSKEEQELKAESGEGPPAQRHRCRHGRVLQPAAADAAGMGQSSPAPSSGWTTSIPADLTERDQGAVATRLDRADQRRRISWPSHRRQARRVARVRHDSARPGTRAMQRRTTAPMASPPCGQ